VSNLRKHLYNQHLEDWVKDCARQKIPITSELALSHITEKLPGLETGELDRPTYSKQGFMEALIEFFVGDDIVSHNDCAVKLV
jgi:hypothetical protein